MKELKIIYLKPKSGFRAPLRSDTLWGLICWGIRSIYGEDALAAPEKGFIPSFQGETPACLLSSAFPYIEVEGEKHHFFPRPILPRPDDAEKNPSNKELRAGLANRKLLKKIQYLEKQYLIDLAYGKLRADQLNDHLLQQTLEEKGLLQPKIKEEAVTHNTIDRLRGGTLEKENKGQLFHIGEQFIKAKVLKGKKERKLRKDHSTGLFFLVQGTTDQLMGALRFLETIGFGGDRNTGKGHFEISEPAPFDWPEIQNPNAMTNLSLYFPKGSLEEEPQAELGRYRHSPFFNYELEERVGRVGFGGYGSIEKPLRIFFKEGSVFPYHQATTYGQTSVILSQAQNDRLPHDVYQYGHGFMLPMHLKLSS